MNRPPTPWSRTGVGNRSAGLSCIRALVGRLVKDKPNGGASGKKLPYDDAHSDAAAFVMMVPELEMPPEKVDKETQMAVMLPRSSE
jgi:hypothetical protein